MRLAEGDMTVTATMAMKVTVTVEWTDGTMTMEWE